MMLFFAVELPDEVRERIFEAGRELEGKGISLVKKENLHITLKFIGEKSEHDAREIIKKASEISFESFSVRVVGVGAFPNERNARGIWVGAQADGLGELAHKIEEALEMEKEKFVGHITVARVKARVDLSEFFEKNKKAEFGEFLVNAFTLKKSTLSSQGALYENAGEFLREGKGRE